MIDPSVLPAFVAVILLFLLPPGPDMAFMVAVGLERGRSAAVRAILGIGTGMSAYAIAVVLGVAGIAASHPSLLDVVKVVGATYLLWLALSALRESRGSTAVLDGGPTARPYLRGVVVSATNPKIALFFLAVLPQFAGAATSVTAQLVMLSAVNVLLEVVLYGAIGLTAGTFHHRVAGRRGAVSTLRLAAACVYSVLAAVVLGDVVLG